MEAEVKEEFLNVQILMIKNRTDTMFNLIENVYINKTISIEQGIHNIILNVKHIEKTAIENSLYMPAIIEMQKEFLKFNEYFKLITNNPHSGAKEK